MTTRPIPLPRNRIPLWREQGLSIVLEDKVNHVSNIFCSNSHSGHSNSLFVFHLGAHSLYFWPMLSLLSALLTVLSIIFSHDDDAVTVSFFVSSRPSSF